MTSSFYELSPDSVLNCVETALQTTSTGRLFALNSYENRVYEVELEDRPKVVIKFYRPGRWSKEAIQEELEFLKEIQNLEIPVAAPLCHGIWEGIIYAIFPKYMGQVLPELNDEQISRLGRLIGRLHVLGAAKKTKHRPVFNLENLGNKSLVYLNSSKWIPENLKEFYGVQLPDILKRIEERWDEVSPHMQRIHGDLHVSNLLWSSDGPFFVDFDDFGMGPRVQDLWLLMPGPLEESQDFLSVLIPAYETFHEFPHHEISLIEDLRKLRMLKFAAWIGQRWEDPAFPPAFPHYGTPEYFLQLARDLSH